MELPRSLEPQLKKFAKLDIDNNNPMPQIITSLQSKNGSVVVVKFNNAVGNCQ